MRAQMIKAGAMFIAFSCLLSAAQAAPATDYPNRPIRLIVPYGAGGPTDMVARELASGLQKNLGQPVVVENKPGGGSIIGVDHVAKSSADGYTMLFATGAPFIINPYLNSKLPYRVDEFAPVAKVASYSMVLSTSPKQPFKTVPELIAYGKAHPGTLTYGSAGNGTSNHLAGELLQTMTGIKMTHVPYRGNSPAMTDVVAGNISMMFDMPATTQPYVQSKRVILMGATGTTRNSLAPSTPTIAEQGVSGFDVSSWFGVLVPAATGQDIVTRLNHAVDQVLNEQAFKAKLTSLGYEVTPGTPNDLAQTIAGEGKLWSEVIHKANIHLQ
ncbi:MFS transporter [Advenella kashmirensis W13003]|uniref:MFS transporter n=1 Tax=Advenella kashmirensis W13003 TaxID=1424334 RepID=V8QZL5_9BURK|nr:MFS transporter [Advenella kashmirensis W13003]